MSVLQSFPATASFRAAPPSDEPILQFEQVSKWYGSVLGVNQVTLELREGITGLVGSNGAGKSTLLRLATGHLQPTLGAVRVCGEDAWGWRAKRQIGYCPDADVFYEEMNGEQFVEAMARLCGFRKGDARARSRECIALVGMEGRANRTIRGYSKGMRQRIKLATALLQDPKLLVLDEPLSGIDPIGRKEFLDLFAALAERGKCLLISSHELEALERLTDHVAIMARGRIAAIGSLQDIRDLLDDHPLSVRIDCDRPRALAGFLMAWEEIVGVEMGEKLSLIVRARNPRRFFARFSQLVLEEGLDVTHLEALDESTHAILGYLLGGSGKT